jgi:hypothetical protein
MSFHQFGRHAQAYRFARFEQAGGGIDSCRRRGAARREEDEKRDEGKRAHGRDSWLSLPSIAARRGAA